MPDESYNSLSVLPLSLTFENSFFGLYLLTGGSYGRHRSEIRIVEWV